MFYLKESSLRTHNPIFQKLEKECMFFPDQQLSYDFANNHVYERQIIDWALENMMESGKDFIDIGAHVGTWSLSFGRKANLVHSFECSPRTYNFLCSNIALNELDYKVKPHNFALGNYEGETSYFIRCNDGGTNGCMRFDYDTERKSREITVPIRTLDSLNLNNIGFIKIDVEGFEKNVLEGAIETIKRNNYPKIIFESWAPWRENKDFIPAVTLREELFSLLATIGYKIISIHGWDEIFLAEKA